MISPIYSILIHLTNLSEIKGVFYEIPTEIIAIISYLKDILDLSSKHTSRNSIQLGTNFKIK